MIHKPTMSFGAITRQLVTFIPDDLRHPIIIPLKTDSQVLANNLLISFEILAPKYQSLKFIEVNNPLAALILTLDEMLNNVDSYSYPKLRNTILAKPKKIAAILVDLCFEIAKAEQMHYLACHLQFFMMPSYTMAMPAILYLLLGTKRDEKWVNFARIQVSQCVSAQRKIRVDVNLFALLLRYLDFDRLEKLQFIVKSAFPFELLQMLFWQLTTEEIDKIMIYREENDTIETSILLYLQALNK